MCLQIKLNLTFSTPQDEEDEAEGGGDGQGGAEGDPTYELASARRNIAGTESLSKFIDNSRKMFMLQVNFIVLFRFCSFCTIFCT